MTVPVLLIVNNPVPVVSVPPVAVVPMFIAPVPPDAAPTVSVAAPDWTSVEPLSLMLTVPVPVPLPTERVPTFGCAPDRTLRAPLLDPPTSSGPLIEPLDELRKVSVAGLPLRPRLWVVLSLTFSADPVPSTLIVPLPPPTAWASTKSSVFTTLPLLTLSVAPPRTTRSSSTVKLSGLMPVPSVSVPPVMLASLPPLPVSRYVNGPPVPLVNVALPAETNRSWFSTGLGSGFGLLLNVTVYVPAALKVAWSVAPGAPEGFQLPGPVKLPLIADVHVLFMAWAAEAAASDTMIPRASRVNAKATKRAQNVR